MLKLILIGRSKTAVVSKTDNNNPKNRVYT